MQFPEFSQIALFATVVTAVIGGMMAMFMTLYLRDRSQSSYDEDKRRAILSDMRESYESQIARLTERLVATDERWRDVNHLVLTSQERQAETIASTGSPSNFIRSLGIDPGSVKTDDNLVFMLTPFTKEENATYRVVQTVCQDNGMICVRGDENHVTGEILPHIVEMILRARVIVANITSRNPNVFYELGIAHALDKQTILLARKADAAPFDVQSRRIVIYNSMEDLERKLTGALLRAYRQV